MFRKLTRKRFIAALVAVTALGAGPALATAPANAEPAPTFQQLAAIQDGLDTYANTPGTVGLSWGIDAETKSVVISVPKSDNDAATKAFLKQATQNDNVRIKRVAGPPQLNLGPGDAILTGSGRCSAALIATDGSSNYVVTAGHCTNIGSSWTTSSGQTIGTTAESSFPGNDYGFIRVTNSSLPLSNNGISSIGEPAAGSSIQKTGSTTGVTSGTLVGYGRTVNYAEGTVYDMIETTACVQPGDSGGLLYQGSVGIGITSGGTIGSCGSGFQSFFQPLSEILSTQSAVATGDQLQLAAKK